MLKLKAIYRIFAVFYIFALLLFTVAGLDHFSVPPLFGLIGLSSIASSSFILLNHPLSPTSAPKHIISAYAIAIVTGILFQRIIAYFEPSLPLHLPLHFQGLAVLSVVFVMATFRSLKIDHPPAVGITLALVLETWMIMTIAVLVVAIAGLLLIPKLFKNITHE